jgi:hypothetical protein
MTTQQVQGRGSSAERTAADGRYLWDQGGVYLVRGFVGCSRGKCWEWWEVLDGAPNAASGLQPAAQRFWTREAAVARAEVLNAASAALPAPERWITPDPVAV